MKTGSQKIILALILICALATPEFVLAQEKGETSKKWLQQYQLMVKGLKCESCIPDVRKALKKLPGVHDAEIIVFDKAGSTMNVEVEPEEVSGEQLISALKNSGFYAKVIAIGEPREVLLENKREGSFFGWFN